MYDEKYIKSKQAILDWSFLLAAYQYIDRSACFACNGRYKDIPVQALPLGEVLLGRYCEIFRSDCTL